MKIPDNVKNTIKLWLTVIVYVIFLALVLWSAAIVASCSSQNIKANETTSIEAEKIKKQELIIKAYENVLHEVWLDKPNYVEDALSESDAFCDLIELTGEDNSVFKLRTAEDSLRYKYMWYHETDD